MRELKFRAWDTKAKCYVKDPILFDNFGQVYVVCDETSDKRGTCLIMHKPNVMREQYTGLKDKNGKEIYEGDIVEEDIDFNSKMTDGAFRYRVYWDDCLLCWALDPIGEESIHDELWQTNLSRRVIGNTHENPELLERKNNAIR